MTYEFKSEEALVLDQLGRKLTLFGLLIILFGIGGIVSDLIFSGIDKLLANILGYVAILIPGILLYRPADNLRNIAKTEGRDIKELMQAISDFNVAFFISGGLIFVLVISLLVSLITQGGGS